LKADFIGKSTSERSSRVRSYDWRRCSDAFTLYLNLDGAKVFGSRDFDALLTSPPGNVLENIKNLITTQKAGDSSAAGAARLMQLITAIPRNGLRSLEIKNELDARNLGLLIRSQT
jgi:hypothetical protein